MIFYNKKAISQFIVWLLLAVAGLIIGALIISALSGGLFSSTPSLSPF